MKYQVRSLKWSILNHEFRMEVVRFKRRVAGEGKNKGLSGGVPFSPLHLQEIVNALIPLLLRSGTASPP